MKKYLYSLAVVCFLALSFEAQAQESFSLANSATGTTLNTLTKVVTSAGVPKAQILATTDTSGAVGIATGGDNTTSGTAVITRDGIAPCVFDNATTAGDFVQISATTAGNCHDVGATRPTSGQIIGVVIVTGGAAGTYKILLDKSIFPTSAATGPLCSVIGSSDTITTATSFASTCSVPSLGVGSFLEIRAHGVFSTTTTASPVVNFEVNAGGTTGLCQHSANNALITSATTLPWDLVCFVQILTTGAPGTAASWGVEEAFNSIGGNFNSKMYCNAASCGATQGYTTTSAQTVSIQETATLVSGESFTLQSLIVRNY